VKARYLTVYKILGFNKLPEDQVSVLLVDKPDGKVTLTADPEAYCVHMDRKGGIANALLRGFSGGQKAGDADERLKAEIDEVKNARQLRTKNGAFLAIEGETEVQDANLSATRQFADFGVCLDALPSGSIARRFRPLVSIALAAIGFSVPARADPRVERVGEVSYLVDEETGKLLYCINIEFGEVTLSVAGPMTADTVEAIRRRLESSPPDGGLTKVVNLLLESQEAATDDLRSFISAWAALEIFVNMIFRSRYESEWIGVLASAAPSSLTRHFDRLREVMKDKHRLLDKFLIVASLLDADSADADAAVFAAAKSVRDSLFHASDTNSTKYPVAQIQNLLRKYLARHLDREDGSLGNGGPTSRRALLNS
jgi:hypothetical protein